MRKIDGNANMRAMVHQWLAACDVSELPACLAVIRPRYPESELLTQDQAVSLVGEDTFTRGVQTGQLRATWPFDGTGPVYRRTDLLAVV